MVREDRRGIAGREVPKHRSLTADLEHTHSITIARRRPMPPKGLPGRREILDVRKPIPRSR
jgi:hypothetical protein